MNPPQLIHGALVVQNPGPSSPRQVSTRPMLEPHHGKGPAMASLADTHVLEARGLLATVLDAPRSVTPQASLDLVQALCELAPAGALPAYPSTTSAATDAVADLRTARWHLRQAIPDEVDVAAVLRLAAAIGCIDAALRAVPS
jgi:hypothetical protein